MTASMVRMAYTFSVAAARRAVQIFPRAVAVAVPVETAGTFTLVVQSPQPLPSGTLVQANVTDTSTRTPSCRADDVLAHGVVSGVNTGHDDVEIRLSADGAARLREATRQHLGRPLAIVIDGLVAMARPCSLRSANWRITGNHSREEAVRLVKGMTPQ